MTAEPAERFWSRVSKGPLIGDCWLWTRAVSDDGFGRYWIKTPDGQQSILPQRFAFHLASNLRLRDFGALKQRCGVPLCVRSSLASDTHVFLPPGQRGLEETSPRAINHLESSARWTDLSRALRAERSRALRDEVNDHGWDRDTRIRALVAGKNPNSFQELP